LIRKSEKRQMRVRWRCKNGLAGHADMVKPGMTERRPGIAGDQN